ncbi:Callose synthase 10 [Apostasia shenzhenica]|uniref:Callose synthase 10 n=1 Tax=Apostasia shenzhenica TaxID=1088818 RepID=A0A2H9ZRM0_9ASPA|nr:Callose synthase 10 [Apostasia shenzhenica]
MEARVLELKRVYTILRALIDVLELLVGDSTSDGISRLILEEVKKVKKSDATLGGDLTPYNIVPLDAPSVTNAIGFFPEVTFYLSCIFMCLPILLEFDGNAVSEMFSIG